MAGKETMIELQPVVRKWAVDVLPYDRNDADIVAAINAKSTQELVILYHNWVSRHVYPTPRKVHLSNAYAVNPLSSTREADLAALLLKIENGGELKPHLSKRVDTVISTKPKIAQRPELDLMLNEWDVHHLHISQTIEPDGFVTRDDPLLFVVFHKADAYILEIMTHGDFNSDHILEIMAREFPNAGLLHELTGEPGQKIIGLTEIYSEPDRTKLRRNGVNSLVEIDGKVYKPSGGITGAGTATRATLDVNKLMMRVANFEKQLNTDRPKFEEIAERNEKQWPANPDFEFGILPETGLGFKETTTGLGFKVA